MQARRYEDVEDTLCRQRGPGLGLPPKSCRLLGKMVAFDPTERFQTPDRARRGDQDGRRRGRGAGEAGRGRAPAGPKTLFVVEKNAKLQDVFRDKFKAHGYRVLISLDPHQALKRYQAAPYHGLIVDCGTVGHDGVDVYQKVLREAGTMGLDLGAILILNEDQAGWKLQAGEHANGAVLVRPVTMKQLLLKVYDLAPSDEAVGEGDEGHA